MLRKEVVLELNRNIARTRGSGKVRESVRRNSVRGRSSTWIR